MIKEHGKNGYPTITKNGMWYATSVFYDGVTILTNIYPNFDDPLYTPYTKEEYPWFSDKQIKDINAPYIKEAVGRRSVMTTYDYSYWNSLYNKRDFALRIEPILKKIYFNRKQSFEINVGGWIYDDTSLSTSQTAIDLSYRQVCKKNVDYQTSDLIRKVVEGGSVMVSDHKDGVMYVFECIT